MPKKINAELRVRALRMVQEHEQDYPSQTAVVEAVAKQLEAEVRELKRQRNTPGGLEFLRVNVMLGRVLQGSLVSSLPWSWLSQAGGLSPMCGPAGRSSAACVA